MRDDAAGAEDTISTEVARYPVKFPLAHPWMRLVWQEILHAARQAPEMYFAPFSAAGRELWRVSHMVQKVNRERAEALARKLSER
jgi:hypothetical protein